MRDEQGRIMLPRLDEQAMLAFARANGGDYRRLSTDESDLAAALVISFLQVRPRPSGRKSDGFRSTCKVTKNGKRISILK